MPNRVATGDPTKGSGTLLRKPVALCDAASMTLKELLKKEGPGVFIRLAEKVGCSPRYVSQCAYGHRNPSPALARKLVAADSRLTLAALRPDVYGKAA